MGGVCRWCLTLLVSREDDNQVSETFNLRFEPTRWCHAEFFFFKAQNLTSAFGTS